MYWNRPQMFPPNKAGGQVPQNPPTNKLVENRQQNTAGLWNGGQVTVLANPVVNPIAEWRSPIFDLRPDLPFLSQGEAEATPVYRSKTGDWGSLWVMVDGLSQTYGGGALFGTSGLRVTYQEQASPIDPSLTRRVNDLIDITPEFAFNPALIATNQQQQSALLQFKPTSDVDPVRYWQVIMYFTWTQDFSAGYAPQLRVQASYY